MLSYLVAGLVTGSLYAIFALVLVTTYNASHVFNFAQGGMAFFLAYCFYWLNTDIGLPTIVSLALSILVIAPIVGWVLWRVLLGRLSTATPLIRLAATIGLSVAMSAGTTLLFGHDQVLQPAGLIGSVRSVVTVAGVNISNEQLLVIGVALVVAIGSFLLLNRTAIGLVTRGAVDSEMMTVLTGTNPKVVVAGTWMAGMSVIGLAGILVMPQVGLNAAGFSSVVAASFAGVVIGRLTNVWWAFGGALLVGVLQSVIIPFLPDSGILTTALRPSIPFLLMVIAIVARSRGASVRDDVASREVAKLATAAERSVTHIQSVMRGTRGTWDRYVGWAVLGVVLVAVPYVFSGFWVGVFAVGMAYAIALLCFRPVTGEAAVVGLCQISFVGIGAVATAQFSTTYGLGIITSMILAALVSALCGLVVGLVCLPLGQLYAAIATYAFALLADQVIFTRPTFSNNDAGVFVDRPTFGGVYLANDQDYLYFTVAVFLIVALVLFLIRRSTLGLRFATIRASRVRASSLGIPIFRSRLALFTLGAGIAGLGGGVIASNQYVAFTGAYSALLGLTWFAVVIAQGSSSMGGAAIAGLSLAVGPALVANYLPSRLAELPAVLFGLLAIMIVSNPSGINTMMRAQIRSLAARLTPDRSPKDIPPPADENLTAASASPVGSAR
ncbi:MULTISPECIES: ABC transporter permease [Nocardiaceae]|uniref:ABC transporter permease n=1 Tax=Nocardiaceae TaxID=85025 RepID=UPI00050C3602|nr:MULTISPECIES: ABC transporter permease [Rhodococcus]KJV03563.1 ABC transporter permease [Rhodococcus sp. PML026]